MQHPATPTDPAAVRAALDWHQARRRGGVGTVTLLVGPVGPAVRAWRGWADVAGRPVAQAASADPGEVARAWAAEALAALDLPALARAWVRAAAGRPVADPVTRHDLDLLWRSLPTDPAAPAAAAARHLLAAGLDGRPADAARLAADLGPAPRLFAGVCGLLPDDRCPALLLLPPAGGGTAGHLADALRALAPLADAVPAVPLAVSAAADAFDAVAGGTGRSAALAREGLVRVPAVSAAELAGRLRAAGVVPPPPAATLDRLAAGGLDAEVAEAFVDAAAAVRRAAPADECRSKPERFLLGQLEATPETAGLFRPNRGLPFTHGSRPGEADLCAERLKLVVEIDGAYYHLNRTQYNRDRKKDWLYQKHGYLVLRFLAEDVVDELSAILSTILEAVALRRAAPKQ